MEIKEACPVCKQRLFMEKMDGTRICANCGHVMNAPKGTHPAAKTSSARPASTSIPQEQPTGVPCPQCGSQAKLLRQDPDGAYVYTCPLCNHTFRKEPVNRVSASAPAQSDGKLDGREIFNIAKKCTVEVVSEFDKKYSLGSGFVFDDGYVLTNAHVVFANVYKKDAKVIQANRVSVNYKGGKPIPAEIVIATIDEDMAILRLRDHTPNIATIAKQLPDTGETIYAVGNSNGEGMCILEGIVADQLRKVNGLPFTMISANTVTGNSGGPVFNAKGEVVAEVTLGSDEAVAMNYGIPVTRIRNFIDNAGRKLNRLFKLK